MRSDTTIELPTEPIEIGPLERKNVITAEGRVIGQLTGAYIDTRSWMVSWIVLQLNKDIMDKLNVKKSFFRTPKARINTNLVRVMSDTVQLNVPMADLAKNLTFVE